MSHLIDAKGKPCPQPVIMAKQAITAGEHAFTVEVDNATAEGNLQRLAGSQGYHVETREVAGVYQLDFVKTGAPCCEETLVDRSHAYTVFVGQDIIGAGDRTLGTSLIRMFFYTLTKSEDLPRSILFMNEGVKLPAGDEQVEAHLKELSEKGVEILVCGTCLNFYGIAEKLKVGTVSNMYDIVSQMQATGKVITV